MRLSCCGQQDCAGGAVGLEPPGRPHHKWTNAMQHVGHVKFGCVATVRRPFSSKDAADTYLKPCDFLHMLRLREVTGGYGRFREDKARIRHRF